MSHLSAAQVEQLKLIGAELREYRQQVKASLETIAAKTYIPMRILLAVENAKAEDLPEPVFVQGFIRRYGDALGINGRLLSERLVVNLESFEIEPAGSLSNLPTPKGFSNNHKSGSIGASTKTIYSNRSTPPPATAQNTTTKLKPFSRTSLNRKNLKYFLAIGVGLLLAALAARLGPMLWANLQQPTAQQPLNPPSGRAKQAKRVALQAPVAKAVKAAINLTDEAWLSVKVDGQQDYAGTAEKGFQRTWNAKQSIVLETGNAGAVTLTLNNQKAQPLGQSGEVKEVVISANGLRTQ